MPIESINRGGALSTFWTVFSSRPPGSGSVRVPNAARRSRGMPELRLPMVSATHPPLSFSPVSYCRRVVRQKRHTPSTSTHTLHAAECATSIHPASLQPPCEQLQAVSAVSRKWVHPEYHGTRVLQACSKLSHRVPTTVADRPAGPGPTRSVDRPCSTATLVGACIATMSDAAFRHSITLEGGYRSGCSRGRDSSASITYGHKDVHKLDWLGELTLLTPALTGSTKGASLGARRALTSLATRSHPA